MILLLSLFGMKEFLILYIDPGTGSLLLQVIVGGIVAGSLYFKKNIAAFFKMFKRKSEK